MGFCGEYMLGTCVRMSLLCIPGACAYLHAFTVASTSEQGSENHGPGLHQHVGFKDGGSGFSTGAEAAEGADSLHMLFRCATSQPLVLASPVDRPNDVCALLSQLGLRSWASVTQMASSHLSSAREEFS